jgi:23S rRNA pseudouridine1911/1915/1917 synthase
MRAVLMCLIPRVDEASRKAYSIAMPPRPTDAPRVIFQDEHLLVLSKPAWLPTTAPDHRPTLVSWARQADSRAPRMHPSSRLDSPVTGVVVLGRSTLGIQSLLQSRRDEKYLRQYIAIAVGSTLDPPSGVWSWSIGVHPRTSSLRMVSCADAAKPARTRYRVVQSWGECMLMECQPQTGRTHQIRVHCAHAGVPLLGDVDYGAPRRITLPTGRVVTAGRVMLHCARVSIPSPIDASQCLVFECPPPEDFCTVARQLGASVAQPDDYLALVLASSMSS